MDNLLLHVKDYDLDYDRWARVKAAVTAARVQNLGSTFGNDRAARHKIEAFNLTYPSLDHLPEFQCLESGQRSRSIRYTGKPGCSWLYQHYFTDPGQWGYGVHLTGEWSDRWDSSYSLECKTYAPADLSDDEREALFLLMTAKLFREFGCRLRVEGRPSDAGLVRR